MPRQAIEALESEIRSLASRIDDERHAGADGVTMAGVERGLAEVRDALHALTPAESLVGFDQTLQGLSQKIDRVASAGQDPEALKQLEGAIVALRGVVSHVASNDALAQLSDEVRVALRQGRPGHADLRCVLDDGAADRGDRGRVAAVARHAGRRCRWSRNGGAEPRRQGRPAPRQPLRPDRGQLSRRPDHAAGREARRLRLRASTTSARSSAGSPTC